MITSVVTLSIVSTFSLSTVQGQVPDTREVAANAPTAYDATEPAVAAGPNWVMGAFYDLGGTDKRGWLAAYDIGNSTWETVQEIDPNTGFAEFHDLSIAYAANPGVGGDMFLVAAKVGGPKLCVSRIITDPLVQPHVFPGQWKLVHEAAKPNFIDRPWLVAGSPNMPYGQEFYLVFMEGEPASTKLAYRRSVDGGKCWQGGLATLSGTGETIACGFCAHATVDEDGPLYVAYRQGGNPKFRFLVATDNDDPNQSESCLHGGTVTFDQLMQVPDPDPGPLTLNAISPDVSGQVPGNFQVQRVPWLAVDPTNPDRLFIAYHDLANSTSTDVNVYVRKLERSGSYWTLGTRVKVNNDQTTYESDQFTPSLTVDDTGTLHVIYYDDRNYTDPGPGDPQQDQQPDNASEPKFDVFYAWAPASDLDFTRPGRDVELVSSPSESALDWTVRHHNPREYNDITWFRYGNNRRIWTTFSGTSQDASQDNKSVIWSARVPWSN